MERTRNQASRPWLSPRLGPGRLAALVLGLMLATTTVEGCGSVKANGEAAPFAPVVSGFDVSDDLTVATVHLQNAAGMEAAGPGGELFVDGDGELRIPLDFAGARNIATLSVELAGSPEASIRIRYFPSSYYATVGATSSGTVVLYTSLPRSASSASSEPTAVDPAESLQVQNQRWADARYVGALPSVQQPLQEQLRQLYLQYATRNRPSVGTLCSDQMTGIDTYWAMVDQRCYVWCTGYARVTRSFLRSIGIPARIVGLDGSVRSLPDGVLVQSSEAHATVELWLDGHWQWVDPTFRVLSAIDGSGTPLSVEGAIRVLADPANRASLRFTRLDAAKGTWVTRPFAEEDATFKESLSTYMTADKKISIPNGGRG